MSERLNMIFVCPNAAVWWKTFERVRDVWIAAGRVGDQPPMPLILAGWIYSSDRDKQERWQALVKWADEHSVSHLIPELSAEDQYCTNFVTTSYPEQNYRPDRYDEKERPSDGALAQAMSVLKHDWLKIAGEELADVCNPTKITGQKKRRLLVTVTKEHKPSWGSWNSTFGPERERFSEFRRRVNDAIAPVHVDHVDFCARDSKTDKF
jgi:hypothetical protein